VNFLFRISYHSTKKKKGIGFAGPWQVFYVDWTFPWEWVWDLATSSFHPLWRALSSHIAVNFFCATNAASDFSLASSQVSIPELHLSASFWYWDVIFLASSRTISARRWFSSASVSRSCNSSFSSSAKFFSASSVTSGSCFAQSAYYMPGKMRYCDTIIQTYHPSNILWFHTEDCQENYM